MISRSVENPGRLHSRNLILILHLCDILRATLMVSEKFSSLREIFSIFTALQTLPFFPFAVESLEVRKLSPGLFYRVLTSSATCYDRVLR